jgi:hypothetical protein
VVADFKIASSPITLLDSQYDCTLLHALVRLIERPAPLFAPAEIDRFQTEMLISSRRLGRHLEYNTRKRLIVTATLSMHDQLPILLACGSSKRRFPVQARLIRKSLASFIVIAK